jgi:hypothetical protein
MNSNNRMFKVQTNEYKINKLTNDEIHRWK